MDTAIDVLIICGDEQNPPVIHQLLTEDKTIVCSYLYNLDEDNLVIENLSLFFQDKQTDVIILCDSFQKFSILELIKHFKRHHIFIPIIVISNRNEIDLVVEIIKSGGENYLLEEQLTKDRLINAIYSALQSKQEQQQLEKVRIENQKLSQVIEQSPVSVVITKAESNKIEYANPMFTQLTGYSFAEIEGECPSILRSGVKTQEEYRSMWETILSGSIWKGEFINKKKSGERYCVSSIISPIRINNHEVTHFVGIQQDITQQKEAELTLQNYANKLEKKSQELEVAYQNIEQNIQKAKRLHRHFFPTSYPIIKDIELEAFYEPAHKIGSDYYNFIQLKDHLIVYVVDVSGSGIDGAFINIFIRQKINRFLFVDSVDKEQISPKELLNFLAEHFVKESFPAEYFICLYVCVLDLNAKKLTYSNAGIQVPPAIVANGILHTLQLGGLPISSAIDIDLLTYDEETVEFKENTTILISTDGIVESILNGEMFGIERLHQLVLEYHYLPPSELKNKINSTLNEIFTSNDTHDDITYVIMQHRSSFNEYKKLIIQSDCCEVEKVINELTDWLANYPIDINSILVGLNEMIYNAIEHGNKFELSKKVYIGMEVREQYLLITIEDDGEGFDWQAVIDKQLDIMNFEERGRGIIFTKVSFDYITYNQKGNCVYLYKKK